MISFCIAVVTEAPCKPASPSGILQTLQKHKNSFPASLTAMSQMVISSATWKSSAVTATKAGCVVPAMRGMGPLLCCMALTFICFASV